MWPRGTTTRGLSKSSAPSLRPSPTRSPLSISASRSATWNRRPRRRLAPRRGISRSGHGSTSPVGFSLPVIASSVSAASRRTLGSGPFMTSCKAGTALAAGPKLLQGRNGLHSDRGDRIAKCLDQSRKGSVIVGADQEQAAEGLSAHGGIRIRGRFDDRGGGILRVRTDVTQGIERVDSHRWIIILEGFDQGGTALPPRPRTHPPRPCARPGRRHEGPRAAPGRRSRQSSPTTGLRSRGTSRHATTPTPRPRSPRRTQSNRRAFDARKVASKRSSRGSYPPARQGPRKPRRHSPLPARLDQRPQTIVPAHRDAPVAGRRWPRKRRRGARLREYVELAALCGRSRDSECSAQVDPADEREETAREALPSRGPFG